MESKDDFKMMAVLEKVLFGICTAGVVASGIGFGLGHRHCIIMTIMWGILAFMLWECIAGRKKDAEE